MGSYPKVKTSCVKCGSTAGDFCRGTFKGEIIQPSHMTDYDFTGCVVDDIPF